MKFGVIAIRDAEGAILAHSIIVGKDKFRKGLKIDINVIKKLKEAGVTKVVAAQPDHGDRPENEAASLLADALAPVPDTVGIRIDAPFTGRVNLFAERAGLLRVQGDVVRAINAVDPAITLATLPDYTRVAAGDMLATVKIIPYAVAGGTVDAVLGAVDGSVFEVHGFKRRKAALILTQTAAISDKVLAKGHEVTRRRLDAMGVLLSSVETVSHDAKAVAAGLKQTDADLVLILGASATSDIRDVCPAGLILAGGTMTRFGMPVIGLPGCARSPAINGADWVLERVICGLKVTNEDIAGMGVGGLLKEIPTRPQPRAYDTRKPGPKRVEIVLLAAGSSSRMKGEDKLLKTIGEIPLIRRSAEAAIASKADAVQIVLPVNASERRGALEGLRAGIIEAKDASLGMAASLRAGLAAVSERTDAVIIALADMPDVQASHFDALIDSFSSEAGREICRAVTEEGAKGHPVLFGRRFFENLAALQGDQGAREIVVASSEFVVDVPTQGQGAVIDLDTRDAWNTYLTENR